MSSAAGSPRLAPQRLLDSLSHHCANGTAGRTALLVVELHRSDRLRALAQHASNPYVLAEIARRVQGTLRAGDRYAFVANDELWVLLAHLPDENLVELAARTLRESLLHPIRVQGAGLDRTLVSLSPVLGGAWAGRRALGDPLAMAAAAADACGRARMLEARIRIERFDDDEAGLHRDALERELRAALNGNELDVHFQPQIELASRRCVAVEALIRWTRRDGTSVSPALVASLCQERGMMDQLTQYVLNNALRNQRQWASQGVDVAVSINLSAAAVSDGRFPLLVAHALSTWRVPGERLTFELTEASILRNEHAAIELMKRLHELGCQLALDDFGTGYSSFSWLRRFPIDELKIDRSFVHELDGAGQIGTQGDDRSVRALIDMAHLSGIRALAEGVETAVAQRALVAAGCDRAQGFRFAPGMPAQAFVDWQRRQDESVLLTGSEAAAIP
ncbi:MAG TPA: EAL domain-containing protein [Burkholderiaceae bacterium]|nr:EAL domain-containing protein [Burkholderiaceae bacterium]